MISDKEIRQYHRDTMTDPITFKRVIERLASAEKALKDLLPEVFCLYQQAGHGQLSKPQAEPDVVKRKYEIARAHFKAVEGE